MRRWAGVAKAFKSSTAVSGEGKCALPQRGLAIGPALALQDVVGNRIETAVGNLAERLPHESALHVGGDAAGALVNRHDATGMQLRIAFIPCPLIPDP